jgi:hypothetical protein
MNEAHLARQRLGLVLAAADVEQAAAAALALDSETDNVPLIRALETAVAVCYARPFTSGDLVGRLDPVKWKPDLGIDWLHFALIDLRMRVYAHTDVDSGREIGPQLEVETQLGDRDARWMEEYWAFPRTWIPHVIELCDEQGERFRVSAAELDARISGTVRDP